VLPRDSAVAPSGVEWVNCVSDSIAEGLSTPCGARSEADAPGASVRECLGRGEAGKVIPRLAIIVSCVDFHCESREVEICEWTLRRSTSVARLVDLFRASEMID
jgi:hypothetical protein